MTLARLDAHLDRVAGRLGTAAPRPDHGRIVRAVGTVLRAVLPDARLGELCSLMDGALLAEIIGLDGDEAILAPIGDTAGLSAGAEVVPLGDVLRVPVGAGLLGRVVDGLGRPLDERARGPLPAGERRACNVPPPAALMRRLVDAVLPTGIRAVDALLACGEGQRIGIYGEPGGGKSTLLASLVRGARAEVVVVALVGERGREVRDFIERQLDAATRARTVLVVATSDRPAVERMKAAYTATTIAEAFRDEGRRVLLVMDSVTRFARAGREIGLAAGEPPTRRGFPPSVMAELPRLMERAGPGEKGSITAFYTVLVEGDGGGDPIAEETRGILDGHIVLSPKIAAGGQYPAIDVLASRSRVMDAIVSAEHSRNAAHVREMMHRYGEIEFLVQVGEYARGVDAGNDAALAAIGPIRDFLRQAAAEATSWEETLAWLARLRS